MNFSSAFYNDPFFSGLDLPRAPALEHRSRHDRQLSQLHQNDDQIFENPFSFMQNTMRQMETRMNMNDFTDENSHGVSFSSSTIMSMDRRNEGQPRIIQATSEKLHGPEGNE
jgi:hypothetical protein